MREPLRTFARDEVQRRNGLDVKEALIPIGDAVLGAHPRSTRADSPFVISSVVVGNVQYPAEVADAVSRKLAATQELQRKDTEIEIERKERTKREVQAQGIANAMQIIRGQLTAMYIQHEAIEAQKLMVNSPNHTVVYIPVGPMGRDSPGVDTDRGTRPLAALTRQRVKDTPSLSTGIRIGPIRSTAPESLAGAAAGSCSSGRRAGRPRRSSATCPSRTSFRSTTPRTKPRGAALVIAATILLACAMPA